MLGRMGSTHKGTILPGEFLLEIVDETERVVFNAIKIATTLIEDDSVITEAQKRCTFVKVDVKALIVTCTK